MARTRTFGGHEYTERPEPKTAKVDYPVSQPGGVGVPCNGETAFSIYVQRPFRPQQLTVALACAPFFMIRDVTIGRDTIFRTPNAMEAIVFTDAHRVPFTFTTALTGQILMVRVSRRQGIRIVCTAKAGCEFPPIQEIEPASLRCLHPLSGHPVGSIDLAWEGWKIPDWCEAHVSDHYQHIGDYIQRKRALLVTLEELVRPSLASSATGSPYRSPSPSPTRVYPRPFDPNVLAASVLELLALEINADLLKDYAGEPFRHDIEFSAHFEGIEVVD